MAPVAGPRPGRRGRRVRLNACAPSKTSTGAFTSHLTAIRPSTATQSWWRRRVRHPPVAAEPAGAAQADAVPDERPDADHRDRRAPARRAPGRARLHLHHGELPVQHRGPAARDPGAELRHQAGGAPALRRLRTVLPAPPASRPRGRHLHARLRPRHHRGRALPGDDAHLVRPSTPTASWLAIVGISPTRPDTGLGYIRAVEVVQPAPEVLRVEKSPRSRRTRRRRATSSRAPTTGTRRSAASGPTPWWRRTSRPTRSSSRRPPPTRLRRPGRLPTGTGRRPRGRRTSTPRRPRSRWSLRLQVERHRQLGGALPLTEPAGQAPSSPATPARQHRLRQHQLLVIRQRRPHRDHRGPRPHRRDRDHAAPSWSEDLTQLEEMPEIMQKLFEAASRGKGASCRRLRRARRWWTGSRPMAPGACT